jgi:hypothetical protein
MSHDALMYCNPLPLEHYQRGRACQWPGYKGRDFRVWTLDRNSIK